MHLICYLLALSFFQLLAPTSTPLLSSHIIQQPPLPFQHPSANTKFQPMARFLLGTEIPLQLLKCCLCFTVQRIKSCHSSSKFTMLSVTITKAFTLPDEGKNGFGQTGELGRKRIALVVRRSDNWSDIVLSTGAKHTTLAEVIPSPNNLRQHSQEWKHQFIPCLFPPKIYYPAAHLQFIFQVATSSLYLQFLKGLLKASFKQTKRAILIPGPSVRVDSQLNGHKHCGRPLRVLPSLPCIQVTCALVQGANSTFLPSESTLGSKPEQACWRSPTSVRAVSFPWS